MKHPDTQEIKDFVFNIEKMTDVTGEYMTEAQATGCDPIKVDFVLHPSFRIFGEMRSRPLEVDRGFIVPFFGVGGNYDHEHKNHSSPISVVPQKIKQAGKPFLLAKQPSEVKCPKDGAQAEKEEHEDQDHDGGKKTKKKANEQNQGDMKELEENKKESGDEEDQTKKKIEEKTKKQANKHESKQGKDNQEEEEGKKDEGKKETKKRAGKKAKRQSREQARNETDEN